MSTALLLTAAEPDLMGFLTRHLPGDGFQLVDRSPDVVLAGDVESVDRWRDRVPVIVLGRPEADAVDRVHAFRRGCDDYVGAPFDYAELVGVFSHPLSEACSHLKPILRSWDDWPYHLEVVRSDRRRPKSVKSAARPSERRSGGKGNPLPPLRPSS